MAGPWFYRSGAAGTGDGLSWANARTTLTTMTSVVAGDRIWVSEDHAETAASTRTITFPGTAASANIVICVDHTQASPGAADYRTTGSVTATGSGVNVVIDGAAYVYGLTFVCGTAGTCSIKLATATSGSHFQRYENCSFQFGVTAGASSVISIGPTSTQFWTYADFLECTTLFRNTGNTIQINFATVTWRGSAAAMVNSGGSIPTTLFTPNSIWGNAVIEGVDLSTLGSGKTIVGAPAGPGNFTLNSCTFGASVTAAATPTVPGAYVYVVNSDSTTANYREEAYTYQGTQTVDTTLVRTSGASDGTTPHSWKLVSTANAKWYNPLDTLTLDQWNTSTVSADVTAVVRGISNTAAMLNNDDVWAELQYLGTAATPLATLLNSTKAKYDTTNAALTADTAAWDSLVTARANTTVYSSGNTIKVASNPGRVFFCTTGGTSSGSEPGGYATAVDGGSVTDNTAIFRAGWRFKISQTMSAPRPQLVGSLFVKVRVGGSSVTCWIDPAINSS